MYFYCERALHIAPSNLRMHWLTQDDCDPMTNAHGNRIVCQYTGQLASGLSLWAGDTDVSLVKNYLKMQIPFQIRNMQT